MNILESDSSVTGKKISVSNKEVAKRERAADETVVAANIEVNSQKKLPLLIQRKVNASVLTIFVSDLQTPSTGSEGSIGDRSTKGPTEGGWYRTRRSLGYCMSRSNIFYLTVRSFDHIGNSEELAF